MGTMPDGTPKNLQVEDGITPDPALPPTAVDESALEAEERKWTPTKIAIWVAISLLGAVAWFMLAIVRGETVNAIWFVFAAVCTYLIGYRFYSKVIERYLLKPNDRRATPAEYKADGKDYVRTDRNVLFGHHFAAIAGAGPLVGPILAAQMGYLPGTIWIIIGVVFAGAVQDYVVMFFSMRRGGRSLGQMAREELGVIGGTAALVATLLIMVIIVAILALVVVNALAESPWGVFSVGMTIPIALFMGVYLRFIRPGKIMEVSLIGFVLLMAAIIGGGLVAATEWGDALFTLDKVTIAWAIIVYGFVAAILPVWLLLAPRDYLSTFMKIGVIVMLALAVIVVRPEITVPAFSEFASRDNGPVFPGALFPFLFVTIACGALSGFHALIASGTTPKLIEKERQTRYIGYGGMLMESFVAIMAMVAASVIDPGVYFAMNSPAAVVGGDVVAVAQTISSWGFTISPDTLVATAKDIGENTILARAGGAPTLAVGIAQILHQVLPGQNTMAFWYHFAILFEALFILTAVDAGTRAGRFMLQDLLGSFVPALKRTESWTANAIGTGGCVALWGYLLYQGVIDPLGGINTLWPLFGISNQMLAGIALMLATVVLIKMKRQQYVWVTILPASWLLICTVTAGFIKLFDPSPAVGFLALAKKYSAAADAGQILAPAKTVEQMQHVIFNAYTNAALTTLFLFVVLSILFYAIKVGRTAWVKQERTDKEAPFQAFPKTH